MEMFLDGRSTAGYKKEVSETWCTTLIYDIHWWTICTQANLFLSMYNPPVPIFHEKSFKRKLLAMMKSLKFRKNKKPFSKEIEI